MALSKIGTPGIADDTAVNGFTPTASNMAGRNKIINGAMVFDQRNGGASVATQSGSLYTVDRWNAVASLVSKYSVQQNAGSVTPPEGFTNYLGATSQSSYSVPADGIYCVRQQVEGFNTADLGWGTANAKTVTLSFWVRSSLTGTFGGAVRNSAETRSYPFSYTISSANTWSSISITIPGDTAGTWLSNNGIGISINFGIGVGSTFSGTSGAWASANYFSATGVTSVVGTSGATWYITGVQLEAGSVATPFEHRQYGQELALCQRYAIVYGGAETRHLGVASIYNSTAINLTLHTPVTMRAQPTLTKTLNGSSQWLETYVGSSGSATNATPELGEGGSTNNFRVYLPGAHSGSTSGYAAWVQTLAGASLTLSAEL